MPRIACPKCKTVVTTTDEQRGTVVPCPQCQCRLKVPVAKPAAPPASPVTAAPPVKKAADQARPPAPVRNIRPENEEEDDDAPTAKQPRKKESNAVTNALGGLGGLIGLGVFILIISGKWVPLVWHPLQNFLEEQGIPEILAIGVTAVIFMVPIMLYSAAHTKSTFLNNIPDDLDFRPARRADFPKLDEEKLERYTQDFEALGFKRLLDYTLVTDVESENQAFGRLFVHPEEHCFGEINQICSPSGAGAPMRCNMTSFLEEGWSISTGDRQTSKYSYAMRRPRGLWRSLAGESVADVFRVNLALRKKIAKALELEVLTDDTSEAYFKRERKNNDERKAVVRRRNGLMLILELWLFDKNPKREWLGQFGK